MRNTNGLTDDQLIDKIIMTLRIKLDEFSDDQLDQAIAMLTSERIDRNADKEIFDDDFK